MGHRILVVRTDISDTHDSGVLERRLEKEGYTVTVANSEANGFYQVSARPFDLMVIVDNSEQGLNADFVSLVRKVHKELLIFVLSPEADMEDRIRCLRAGADDCLVTPTACDEVIARVEALLRRGRLGQLLRLAVSDLIMDLGVRRVTRGGQPISLTGREFELLETLMRRAHRVVRRDELAQHVWNNVQRATPLDNVIDVHIGHLRKKIHARGMPLIHTARGVGFVLSDKQPA